MNDQTMVTGSEEINIPSLAGVAARRAAQDAAQAAPQGDSGDRSGPSEQPVFTVRDLSVCLLYTSPSPRDPWAARMPSSA